jgi:hypothetical protein
MVVDPYENAPGTHHFVLIACKTSCVPDPNDTGTHHFQRGDFKRVIALEDYSLRITVPPNWVIGKGWYMRCVPMSYCLRMCVPSLPLRTLFATKSVLSNAGRFLMPNWERTAVTAQSLVTAYIATDNASG